MTKSFHPASSLMVVGLLSGFALADVKADMESARSAFEAGKFAEAQKLYAQIVAGDPKQYDAIVRLGALALFSNHVGDADEWLSMAIRLKPENPEAKLLRAEAFYRRDDFENAAPLLRAAGQEAKAKKLDGFVKRVPYEVRGAGPSTSLKFIATDPLPLVRVRVNGGKEVAFLIDTGGGETTIDSALAKELGIQPLGTEQATFAGGRTTQLHHARMDSLTLGDWVVHNIPAMLMNTRRLSGPLFGGKHQVDGVIGTVLLYHFLATLDYPQGQLTLRSKWAGRPNELTSAATRSVRFWLVGDHTMVAWCRVEKLEPLLFFVDTGLAGGGVSLTESVIKEAGIKLLENQARRHLGGGGFVRSVPFRVKELALGEAKQHDVQGWFDGRSPFENAHGFRIAGIISHDFFKPYAVTFDFQSMQLTLMKK